MQIENALLRAQDAPGPNSCSDAFRSDIAEGLFRPPSTMPGDERREKQYVGAGREEPAQKASNDKVPDKTEVKKAETAPDYSLLVRQLGNNDWRTREAAQRDLSKAGPAAVPFVYGERLSADPEVARRVRDVLQHMVRHFSVEDLQKSPQLLNCLPPYSLADRRESANTWIASHPNDAGMKDYFRSLVNESEFLRLNPKFVEQQIKYADRAAVDLNQRDYMRESYKRYGDSLKELDKLSVEIKTDYLLYCADPAEKKRLALEALTQNPSLTMEWPQRNKLQASGVFNDPEFADRWVLAGGDPLAVSGRHKNFSEIEKYLTDRITESRKAAGGKDNGKVADAVHLLAIAHERQGHSDKAIKLYTEEIAIQRQANANDQSIRGNLMYLANLQVKSGKTDDGIKTYETIAKSDRDAIKANGSSSGDAVYIIDRLISLYENKGDVRKVADLEEGALKDGLTEGNKERTAARHVHAAQCLEKLKDLKGAEKHLLAALDIKTDGGKEDYPWAVTELSELGGLCARHNRNDDAIRYYRRAYELVKDAKFGRQDVPVLKGFVQCLIVKDKNDPQIAVLQKRIAERER